MHLRFIPGSSMTEIRNCINENINIQDNLIQAFICDKNLRKWLSHYSS